MGNIKKVCGVVNASISKINQLGFLLDSYTKLLLHLDNNVTDSETTPKTVTNNGVTFSDTIKKFGTYSAYFDGASGTCLSIPDSDDFCFGATDFTVDFCINFSSVSQYHTIFSQAQNPWDGKYYMLFDWRHNFPSGGGFRLHLENNGTDMDNLWYWTPTINTWYHVALVRTGNIWKIFIDGSQSGADYTNSATLYNYTDSFYIGNQFGSGGSFNGYLDEFRISKGVARWTSNFTPPSSAYYQIKKIAGVSN
jgi:hypothetical protein